MAASFFSFLDSTSTTLPSLPTLGSLLPFHSTKFLLRGGGKRSTVTELEPPAAMAAHKLASIILLALLFLVGGSVVWVGRGRQASDSRNEKVERRLVDLSNDTTYWDQSWKEREVPGVVGDPELVVSEVNQAINSSMERRNLGYFSCGTGNPIDDCWRCDPRWHHRRRRLADCGIGFGRNAIGGRNGQYYVVSDSGDDDPVNPKPGTLRHAVIQEEPLWIVFKNDMVITLKQELIMNSFKTIDGRGAKVEIAHGACITIQYITNVIIHGITIHHCKPTGNAMVRSSPTHYGWRTIADGDAVSIFGSSHVWVDHCTLYNCADGLVDAIIGSTAITISNNYFSDHNEVMLLGHSDSYARDRMMQVTIAFNHFGERLIQRMPRCRHGYFHVVNNDYTHWEMYAIGGSANPTINSQGNRYLAPNDRFAKQVTKRVQTAHQVWRHWNWRSEGDLLLNGAFFIPSGAGSAQSYSRASSLGAKSSSMIGSITSSAGALNCRQGSRC